MGCHAKINYALGATLLAGGATLAEAAQKVGAKNAESLRVGLARRGVTQTLVRTATEEQICNESITLRLAWQAGHILRQKSERTRQTLADVVERQAEVLATVEVPKNRDLANLHADTTQKVIKSAAAVFGWEDESRSALVFAGQLDDVQHVEPAIEVESSAERIQTPA